MAEEQPVFKHTCIDLRDPEVDLFQSSFFSILSVDHLICTWENCPTGTAFVYNTIGDIIRHIQQEHISFQPFFCPCGKHFRRKSDADRHVRTQNNDRIYACQDCDKRFNRQDGLVNHIRAVHGYY